MSRIQTLNTTDAAAALGVSRKTLKAIAAREGVEPCAYVEREVHYKKSDINRLIRRRSDVTSSPGTPDLSVMKAATSRLTMNTTPTTQAYTAPGMTW